MIENVENLILEHLRNLPSKIDQAADDLREVKSRLATLEAGQGTILQHIGHMSTTIAHQQVSFDRLTERVERLEKRLELSV